MPREPIFTREFNLASISHIFFGFSFFLFIHLPRFLADLGADEVGIGLLVGAAAVAAIASRPPFGRLMDTKGRRPILLIGGLLNVSAILLYLTVTSLGIWLVAVQILHGMAEGIMFTAMFTYIADVIPQSRRTEGLALFGVAGFIPMAVAGVVGDVILDRAGFDELFILAAAVGIVSWLLTAALPERSDHIARGDHGLGLIAVMCQRDLLPIWLAIGVFGVALTSYLTFLRTFIDEVGFGSVGAFFVAYAVSSVFLRLLFAWVPKRIGEKKVLYPSFAVLAIAAFVLASAQTATGVVIAGILAGSAHGYIFPILLGLALSRASDGDRGSATAFFTAIISASALLGAPLLGLIVTVGGYPTMYASTMVIIGVGATLYAIWDRRHDLQYAPSGRTNSY